MKLSVMLLNDIEDQLKELFTGNEIISLTNEFADSVGEKVTFHSVGFNSKKDILTRNINDLSDDAKIKFFKEIKLVHNVASKPKLVQQIDELIDDAELDNSSARKSISDLLSKHSNKVVQSWKNAVRFYEQEQYRDALDSIRLTMELLFKEVLGNAKSLENQKETLGKYLKQHGISTQFRNLFFRILDMYEKIQNDNAKHDVPDKLSREEISFLMNESVLIIKFISDCDRGRQ